MDNNVGKTGENEHFESAKDQISSTSSIYHIFYSHEQ